MSASSEHISVGELQTQLPKLVKQFQGAQRTVVVTQDGRPAAVLLSVHEYERLFDLADLGLDELIRIDEETKHERGIPAEEVIRELRARYPRDGAG